LLVDFLEDDGQLDRNSARARLKEFKILVEKLATFEAKEKIIKQF